ncbi:MAG: DNA polymerase III subunit delta [Bacteroidia bacterium]
MNKTFDEIIRDLKNKVYHPVYFLQGDEPYYIDVISDFVENNVLSDTEKEFNQMILYGRDVSIMDIISTAKRYPMMANYQVVIIKEAQDIKNLFPKPGKEIDEDEESPFLGYLKHPQKSTLLVFCHKYKMIDKRTRIAKTIEKQAVLYESKKLYDNKLPDWVTRYSSAKGFKIDENAAVLLSEYIGNDLTRMANEVDKLAINITKDKIINTTLIEQFIGISKEFNVFELQNALGVKNILKANQIINYFAANQKANPLVMTLGNLYGYFNKLMKYHVLADKSEKNIAAELGVHPFFAKDYSRAAASYKPNKLKEIFSLLREYDMRSKGVNNESAGEGELLKEMIYKILH